MRREVAKPDRILRIGNVDKRRAVVEPDQGIFLSGIRIGPAPHVISVAGSRRAQLDQIKVPEQIDIVAGIAFNQAVHAFAGMARCRLERGSTRHGNQQQGALEKSRH